MNKNTRKRTRAPSRQHGMQGNSKCCRGNPSNITARFRNRSFPRKGRGGAGWWGCTVQEGGWLPPFHPREYPILQTFDLSQLSWGVPSTSHLRQRGDSIPIFDQGLYGIARSQHGHIVRARQNQQEAVLKATTVRRPE